MKKILVTSIGSIAADVVIKNLKEKYIIIGCDINPKEWIVDSYNVSKFYKVPLATSEDYIEYIYEICIKENIDIIIPLTDIEIDVFNNNRFIFNNSGIKLCISSKKTIDLCRNKAEISRFLKSKKVCNTIETNFLSKIELRSVKFPVVCKPYNGRSSQGVYYVNSIDELESLIKYIDVDNYIIQPKINGSVITVDVVRHKKTKTTVISQRKELIRTSNGAGLSIYIFNNQELELTCIQIAEQLDINGCVNFEFIEDINGKFYFMECNPRFSGGVEFSCMTGYDYIYNHIKCFEYEEIDLKVDFKNQYICRKYEEYITRIED